MIVFLNGAFGVGKTSTARILHEALPGSLIFDPESVGAIAIAALRDEELGIEIRTDRCTPAEVGASILHAL